MSLYKALVSISVGVFSKIMLTHSLKIGIVVIKTKMVNKKVQIGSAIENFSGFILIIIPAVITPIL